MRYEFRHMIEGDIIDVTLKPGDDVRATIEYVDTGEKKQVVSDKVVYNGVHITGVTKESNIGVCVVKQANIDGWVLEPRDESNL